MKENIIATSYPIFSIKINRPANVLFNLLVMRHFGRWDPRFNVYDGNQNVYLFPIRQGNKFIDFGPEGLRPSCVTQYNPPNRLGFRQTIALRFGGIVAKIDLYVMYTLLEESGSTLVLRDLAVHIEMSGWQRCLEPVVRYKVAIESQRILDELKCNVEFLVG